MSNLISKTETANNGSEDLSLNNTKSLLKHALDYPKLLSRKGIADRLFATWFDRLVYPQIWEDPEVDIEALGLNKESKIFTISSGGCNVMNYLTEEPAEITVVDLNENHLALLELKLIAAKHLTQNEFFDFFGKADQKSNIEVFDRALKSHLSKATEQYWCKRIGLTRKRRIDLFRRNFYQFGLLGQFIGLIHWVSRRLGYDISQIMQAKNLQEQQELFDQYVAPVFDTRLLRFLCKRTSVLYSLGIPPSQYDEMHQDSQAKQQGMHELLKERARRLACDFPLESNYFAWQAFARHYDTENRKAIPRYLQADYFESLKQQTDKVSCHHLSLTQKLQDMPANSLNAYLFLDAQDWMNNEQLNELWTQVTRTAMPGARVVFRTAGETSPLEEKLSPQLLEQWQTNPENNLNWTKQDRSGIYGGVFMYEKLTETQPTHSQTDAYQG